jgi:hypothetical protein
LIRFGAEDLAAGDLSSRLARALVLLGRRRPVVERRACGPFCILLIRFIRFIQQMLGHSSLHHTDLRPRMGGGVDRLQLSELALAERATLHSL